MMKSRVPPASPAAYVKSLGGWRRDCVELLRDAVRTASAFDEAIKWGHLVYLAHGPVLLIRRLAIKAASLNKTLGDPTKI